MRIEWKPGAVRKLRYMQPTVDMLEAKGRSVLAAANQSMGADENEDGHPHYVMASRPGARKPWGRHRVSIATVSIESRKHEGRTNTLVRLLSGGGA